MAKVLSVQVGRAKAYGDAQAKDFLEKEWFSASFKEVSQTPLFASFSGLSGDEVADKMHHGGIDKAIFANSYENYAHWASFLEVESLPYGALAENLTIKGLHESNVTLGEIHQIGTAILQVSQPRKPCWKISRRWNHKAFTNEIFTSGLTGWYYKVLQEGIIGSNNDVRVIKQKKTPQISILEANNAFREPERYRQILETILNIPSLASSYQESIVKRLNNESDLGYMKTE
ncbi:MOSC domain-containing protein [Sulfurospirillum oryzae]|uniref:MOSC domain-containing protein n=1 Tax=Sulfurospirillum oryzae TaxID=2976535 RepID=UPI0021E88BF5|nr:MOSC domain-containing protein [Sulfurospirillum oryzae]